MPSICRIASPTSWNGEKLPTAQEVLWETPNRVVIAYDDKSSQVGLPAVPHRPQSQSLPLLKAEQRQLIDRIRGWERAAPCLRAKGGVDEFYGVHGMVVAAVGLGLLIGGVVKDSKPMLIAGGVLLGGSAACLGRNMLALFLSCTLGRYDLTYKQRREMLCKIHELDDQIRLAGEADEGLPQSLGEQLEPGPANHVLTYFIGDFGLGNKAGRASEGEALQIDESSGPTAATMAFEQPDLPGCVASEPSAMDQPD